MHEHKGGALTEVTLLILLSLYEENHGYGIMQFIKEATQARVQLGAGTLYGALNTLETKHWIKEVPVLNPSRKKQYLITEEGKAQVLQEQQRLLELTTMIDHITKEDF